tara:strand:+ start:2491 stop:2844 length:354 start_codon:yes stop_codon:yes gene_type:complete
MKYKLVVAMRSDLKLSSGKMSVQVSHAAVSCSLKAKKNNAKEFQEWYREGQKKVVVRVENKEMLEELKAIADSKGITNCMITDAGLTEIPPNTTTCLGIGPVKNEVVDKITGQLSLL